jgi:hypothetical protein
VGLLIAAARPAGAWLYLGLHVAGAAAVFGIAWAHERRGGRFWTFVRHWYLVPAVILCFRELHYVVPIVHPFDSFRWDRALAAIDRRWFGDVDGFFLGLLSPIAAELLHLCYASYYFSMLVVAGVLYAKKDLAPLREYLCVLLTAIFLSYLCYFAVPAVGPHVFFETRPAVLDGWLIGGAQHRMLVELELRTADAFPSGHTLISLVVLSMSWRTSRRLFWTLLVPTTGCILATMALRYHYVTDVVAAFALFPFATALGFAIHRKVDVAPAPAVNVLTSSGR